MDTVLLKDKFARIGARLKISDPPVDPWTRRLGGLRVDIGRDARGEFYDLIASPRQATNLCVVDVQPRMRHLLLMADTRGDGRQKFLCGHDERHWFVAAVPEAAHAANVKSAMTALKPAQARGAEARVGLKLRHQFRRKNRAFVRQGEWFFLPRPDLHVDAELVLRREPISRGNGGKPHVVDEMYRTGGEAVYVSPLHPTGLSEAAYKVWIARNPDRKKRVQFRIMRRNAGVFVRGKVRHPDHRTIVLNGWHEVQMNTEHQARAMRHVAFLD